MVLVPSKIHLQWLVLYSVSSVKVIKWVTSNTCQTLPCVIIYFIMELIFF